MGEDPALGADVTSASTAMDDTPENYAAQLSSMLGGYGSDDEDDEAGEAAGAEFFDAFANLPEEDAATMPSAAAASSSAPANQIDVEALATTGISPGCAVQLRGLKQAAHLNGQCGVVLREDPEGTGRWEVQLVREDGGTEVKAIKLENLTIVGEGDDEELEDVDEVLRPESVPIVGDDGVDAIAPAGQEALDHEEVLGEVQAEHAVIGPGSVVRIEGLQKAAHLNGQRGTVLQQDPAGTGRWEIEICDENGFSEVKAIKPDNLVVEEALEKQEAPSDQPGAKVANEDKSMENCQPRGKAANGDGTMGTGTHDIEIGPGCLVRIDGLQKAAHLNGRRGTILQQDPAGTGRWEVELQEADGNAEVKAIREENLIVEEGAPADVQEPEEQEIGPGAWVRIDGLQKAAHLNGLCGSIIQEDPAGTGRWEVELTLEDGRVEVKAIRPENLVLEAVDAEAEDGPSESEDEEMDDDGGDGAVAAGTTGETVGVATTSEAIGAATTNETFEHMDDNELAAQAVQAEITGDSARASALTAALSARKSARGDVSSRPANNGPQVEDRMEIPSESVGRVIGAGGETIRDIAEESGATLNFPRKSAQEGGAAQILVIRGTANAVENARRLVHKVLSGKGKGKGGDDVAGGAAGFEDGVCKWFAAGFCRNRPDASNKCRNGLHDGAAGLQAEATWVAEAPIAGSSMPEKRPVLLLLDLEGGGNQNGRDGEDEIIEVPVLAMCGATGRELGRFHRFARPGFWDREIDAMRRRYPPACFNAESNARPFPSVIAALKDWMGQLLRKAPEALCNEDFLFVTCGNWDIKTALPRQSNKPLPGTVDLKTQELLFSRWCNLKEAFRDHFQLSEKAAPTGMRGMLKRLKIRLSGQHHLGMDDVSNLSKILRTLITHGAAIQPTGHAKDLAKAASAPVGGKGGGKKGGKGGGKGKGPCGKSGNGGTAFVPARGTEEMPAGFPPQMSPPPGFPPPMPPPPPPPPGTPPAQTRRKRTAEGSPGALPKAGAKTATLGMWGMPLSATNADYKKPQLDPEEDSEEEETTEMRKFLRHMPVPGQENWDDMEEDGDNAPTAAKKVSKGSGLGLLAGVLNPTATSDRIGPFSEEPPAKVPKISSLLASLPKPKMSE